MAKTRRRWRPRSGGFRTDKNYMVRSTAFCAPPDDVPEKIAFQAVAADGADGEEVAVAVLQRLFGYIRHASTPRSRRDIPFAVLPLSDG